MEVPGRHGVNYYMCLGVSPEVDAYAYNKVTYGVPIFQTSPIDF